MSAPQALVEGRQHARLLRMSFVHQGGPADEFLIECVVTIEGLSHDLHVTSHISRFGSTKTGGGIAFYKAELVPRAAVLQLRQNYRLFERELEARRWCRLTDHFGHSIDDAELLIVEVRHEVSNNYLQGQDASSDDKNEVLIPSRKRRWRPDRRFNNTHADGDRQGRKPERPYTVPRVGPQVVTSWFTNHSGRLYVAAGIANEAQDEMRRDAQAGGQ